MVVGNISFGPAHTRIRLEDKHEQAVKLARQIEDDVLTKCDGDYKQAIHQLALRLANIITEAK
jgi:hypothetical protein